MRTVHGGPACITHLDIQRPIHSGYRAISQLLQAGLVLPGITLQRGALCVSPLGPRHLEGLLRNELSRHQSRPDCQSMACHLNARPWALYHAMKWRNILLRQASTNDGPPHERFQSRQILCTPISPGQRQNAPYQCTYHASYEARAMPLHEPKAAVSFSHSIPRAPPCPSSSRGQEKSERRGALSRRSPGAHLPCYPCPSAARVPDQGQVWVGASHPHSVHPHKASRLPKRSQPLVVHGEYRDCGELTTQV